VEKIIFKRTKMKKYIKEVQIIAFCGLVTLIFLIIALEFLEWAVKFSFWDGTLGVLYLSLNIFQKLIVLWVVGIPVYLIKKTFERK
jgi:hypothetical protein